MSKRHQTERTREPTKRTSQRKTVVEADDSDTPEDGKSQTTSGEAEHAGTPSRPPAPATTNSDSGIKTGLEASAPNVASRASGGEECTEATTGQTRTLEDISRNNTKEEIVPVNCIQKGVISSKFTLHVQVLAVHMYQELEHARLIVRDNSGTLIILMDMENHTVAASLGTLAIDEVSDVATSLPRTAC